LARLCIPILIGLGLAIAVHHFIALPRRGFPPEVRRPIAIASSLDAGLLMPAMIWLFRPDMLSTPRPMHADVMYAYAEGDFANVTPWIDSPWMAHPERRVHLLPVLTKQPQRKPFGHAQQRVCGVRRAGRRQNSG
jgi:hypothetical protein